MPARYPLVLVIGEDDLDRLAENLAA